MLSHSDAMRSPEHKTVSYRNMQASAHQVSRPGLGAPVERLEYGYQLLPVLSILGEPSPKKLGQRALLGNLVVHTGRARAGNMPPAHVSELLSGLHCTATNDAPWNLGVSDLPRMKFRSPVISWICCRDCSTLQMLSGHGGKKGILVGLLFWVDFTGEPFQEHGKKGHHWATGSILSSYHPTFV